VVPCKVVPATWIQKRMTSITTSTQSLSLSVHNARGWLSRPLRWAGGVVTRNVQNIITALVQIWANKARSVLTTLGIIIAVTSTITVVSFTQGFGDYATGMIRGFGTNMMFVVPWFGSERRGDFSMNVKLDVHDIRAVGSRCDKVRRISPAVFTPPVIEYGRERIEDIELNGVSEDFQSIRSYFVAQGRFFGPIDVESAAYVCVLGREVLDLLRADESIIGDYVFINGLRHRVLGILEPKGNMMGERQDRFVAIPYTTALKMSPTMRRFMAFMVEATSDKDVDECALQIASVLRERHNLLPGQPNDFRIFRQDELLKMLENAKVAATSILAGIVGISLIVGGIGVMNMMLVSVTERTREIGLRKSVGGRRRDILLQFLTEAVVLATVGGAIGIVFGYSICYIATLHPSMVKVIVPAWAVLLALGFSASVGVVFGLIPAFKAAILNPIDALRHE